MQVVGGTPQMMNNSDKVKRSAVRSTASKRNQAAKQYVGSVDRGSRQREMGLSGGSLQAFNNTASGTAASRGHNKAGSVSVHQSFENGKIAGRAKHNVVDNSQQLDNLQMLHDQQRQLVRDNYLSAAPGNQSLGLPATLENSKSASNYQKMTTIQHSGQFNQHSLAYKVGNANTSMGAIQNNQDLKRNLRMSKMKHGAPSLG